MGASSDDGQSLGAATATKMTFDAPAYDTHGWMASSTYTPLMSGYFMISAMATFNSSPSTSNEVRLIIRKNGNTNTQSVGVQTVAGQRMTLNANRILWFNGSTDYVEIYIYSSGAQGMSTTAAENIFTVHFIGDNAIA